MCGSLYPALGVYKLSLIAPITVAEEALVEVENFLPQCRQGEPFLVIAVLAAAKQLVTEDPAVTEVLLTLALWTVANNSGY